MKNVLPLTVALAWPLTAYAAEGNEADTTAKLDADANAESNSVDDPAVTARTTAPAAADEPLERRSKDDRWIDRWAPEPNMGEIGAFGGIYRAGDRHELFEPDMTLPDQGFKAYNSVAGEVGARVGYYPSRFFGVEVEGGAMPTETSDFERATMWNARGSLVGQLGKWSVTPFALAGAGMLGVSSQRAAVGNDIDPSVHFGGGVKVNLNRYAQVRLDVRDVVGNQRGVENAFKNHSLEALVGVSVTLGRSRAQAPLDSDGDGWLDPDDQCVHEPGVDPDGCPVPDTDGDGWLDPQDECVHEAGVAPHGCPIPDTDGDGWLDPDDQCVQEAGVEPHGCPIRDTDGDGMMDPDDQCVQEPETANGFEDDDGCPDELPKELEQFNGVMEGIRFQSGKDRILPRSLPRLDNAAEVMNRFSEIRIEISGHTDNRGPHPYNLDLSQRRADAVRNYLIGKGIAAERIETRGVGPDEPIASNKTSKSRAKNRRIEFKVLTAGSSVSTAP